jgi:peptide/nickel transport system ATP-binding protein
MMSDAMLEVNNLSVGDGTRWAVRNVSMSVGKGEKVGVVGESGAGKSMFGMALMGLLPLGWHLVGEARIGEHNLVAMSESDLQKIRGRDVSVVFQDSLSALNPVKRIDKQLEWVVKNSQVVKNAEIEGFLTNLLKELGLDDPKTVLRKYPHQLSGGQRQRILIAMAIACQPKLIIADEPTTSVDTVVQLEVLETLMSSVNHVGASLLLITHDLAIVSNYCDRVMVMYAGKIVEQGPVIDVLQTPKHPYTKALIESHISLDRFAANPDVRLPVIPGLMPTIDSFPTGCAFRTRCVSADDVCKQEPDERLMGNQVVMCWKALEKT